jgi:hypothetical protein
MRPTTTMVAPSMFIGQRIRIHIIQPMCRCWMTMTTIALSS